MTCMTEQTFCQCLDSYPYHKSLSLQWNSIRRRSWILTRIICWICNRKLKIKTPPQSLNPTPQVDKDVHSSGLHTNARRLHSTPRAILLTHSPGGAH